MKSYQIVSLWAVFMTIIFIVDVLNDLDEWTIIWGFTALWGWIIAVGIRIVDEIKNN